MNALKGYHAHVYFDVATREAAVDLREEIDRLALDAGFEVKLGRVHDKPVGPHPKAMYQVAFPLEGFATLVPWLMQNRGSLDVLVHGETGEDLLDHTQHVLWLGHELALKLEVFDA